MGTYINIGNAGFQRARNSEYVDKSGLIAVVNSTLFTERQFSCVTRCRRFGKSMAARMLCAYYDRTVDSHDLFQNWKISKVADYEKHLNQYDVIYIGFPNWWSTMPMPVWTQLEKLDFEGKIIKPFVTHEGSGFGRSLSDLKKLCPGATIASGLSIQGSVVSGAKDKVASWVNE